MIIRVTTHDFKRFHDLTPLLKTLSIYHNGTDNLFCPLLSLLSTGNVRGKSRFFFFFVAFKRSKMEISILTKTFNITTGRIAAG